MKVECARQNKQIDVLTIDHKLTPCLNIDGE